jgi:hypothetical protein
MGGALVATPLGGRSDFMDIENLRPFSSIKKATRYYAWKACRHYAFLNDQVQTGFDAIDIKRFETRQAVAFKLGISAIVMSSVALEECLKTLLKYHHFFLNLPDSPNLDLKEWEGASLAAEDTYGTFKLHSAIQKARKENLITEDEELVLLSIKDQIRNAFVHSDKSKIFDPASKSRVDVLKIENGRMIHAGHRLMSMLGMNIGQGIAEKRLADKHCREIFERIDTIILTICKRFWQTHSRIAKNGSPA